MILARYILRAHIAPFLFGTSVIMGLFLLQYLMRWIDQLAGKGLDVAIIGEFIVLNLSWIVVLAIPIGVLFSTLMAFGGMSAAHETTIMKASGVGLMRMMTPVVLAGVMLWAGSFWYTDNVLPDTNLRLSGMMRDITRTKPSFALEAGQFTTHIDGITILARNVDSSGLMLGVTIYDRTNFERFTVVSADSGRMAFSPSLTKLVVQLQHGEIHQTLSKRPNDYRVIRFDRHQMVLQADRFFFEQTDVSGSSRSDREMSIGDMQQIVNRTQHEERRAKREFDSVVAAHVDDVRPALAGGWATTRAKAASQASIQATSARARIEGLSYRIKSEHETANKYLVEINKKYAIPFACVIFVIVGCPLGMITRGGNFGISAMISLGFYIVYWVTLIGGEKLADRNILPPAVAMWSGNVLFCVIAVLLVIKVNYETTPLKSLIRRFRQKQEMA